ncbi:MAG: GWxTD domain-containing protein [Phycisphaerae bacterium]|nr:GWxTD domain-containing protein [Gemmatimonadaceae bacterium]
MRHSRPQIFRWSLMAAALAITAACASGNQGARPSGAAGTNRGPFLSGQAPDMNQVYQGMGLISATGPMPFVGNVSFMSTASVDTTLMLLAVSLPATALNFQRINEQYVATYTVRIELRRGLDVVQEWDAREVVKVPTFKETQRTDESVIWQQYLRVLPGDYTMIVGFKDANSIRATAQNVALEVPRMVVGSLSTPLPIYEAIARRQIDSLPRLLARPRSSVSFSNDSVLPIYIESTGLRGPSAVTATLVAEGNAVVWRDSSTLDPRGGSVASNTFVIPVRQMGIGVVTLNLTRAGWTDTSSTRLFVTLGEDLPIASFEEMVRYLRYFTTTERLRQLREATPAARPQAWTDFLRATDPIASTNENEGLRDYFNRIRVANVRFRDDALIGWTSDRGVAFVGLGDPDQIFDTQGMDPTSRSRQQIWEYQGETRLRLIFLDNGGMGRFRLTASNMAELEAAIRRRIQAVQPR